MENIELNGEVSDDLELIRLVKSNPILWNNSLKSYSKTCDKNNLWAILGQNLSIPLSGSDAQKKFTNWRTSFGRIHKKVLQSEPKSGFSSDQPVFVSTWPLYNELLFLKDVIRPRITKSNFVKPTDVLVSEKSLPALNKKIFVPKLKTSSMEDINQAVYLQNTPLENTLLKNLHSPELISTNDSCSYVNYEYLSEPATLDNSPYDSMITGESDVESVISTASNPKELKSRKKIKIETPPPDQFYKQKNLKMMKI